MSLNSTFIPVVSSRYPSDWRFWVFIVIFAALYFAFSSRSAKNRRTELSEVAPCIGLLWLDTLPAIPLGIAFLQPGMDGGFGNVMSGSRAGCQMTIFDFEYETGITIRTERTHAQTVAAFRSEHVVLPAFQFGPESVMRKMLTVGSTEQFKFESSLPTVHAPVGHYLLRSTEQSAAGNLFDPEMLEFFNGLGLQREPWFLEGNREWLVVWEHNNIVGPQNYSRFVQQTSTIAATIFGYAKLKLAASA